MFGDRLRALRAVDVFESLDWPAYRHWDWDELEAMLADFEILAEEHLAPANRIGDVEATCMDLTTGQVVVPRAIHDGFRRLTAADWHRALVPAAATGPTIPRPVVAALEESFAAANPALALTTMLTNATASVIAAWGTSCQRTRHLPPLRSGASTATLPLDATLPATVSAEACPDGGWQLTGETDGVLWGAHDLTGTISHLIVASTARSTQPTVFVVRQNQCPEHASTIDDRVWCRWLTPSLGLRAAPDCTLVLDDAPGEMIGPEGAAVDVLATGIAHWRSSIANAAVAVAQQGIASATRSRPMVSAFGVVEDGERVRRSAAVAATRQLAYATAAVADVGGSHPDGVRRARASALEKLLSPLAAGWSRRQATRTVGEMIEAHGRHGIDEDNEHPRLLRDTHTVASLLASRPMLAAEFAQHVRHDDGAAMSVILDDLTTTVTGLGPVPGAAAIDNALATLEQATDWIVQASPESWRDTAVAYFDLGAAAIAGGLLARLAESASRYDTRDSADAARRDLAYFVADQVVGTVSRSHALILDRQP